VPLTAQQFTFLAQVGGNVRRLRVARKLTQERLAELVGINPRTVQKIEAGKLNVLATTLERLKEALKCDWDELMDDVA
jgi:transcriptional regulator with XRE-family HTH domain